MMVINLFASRVILQALGVSDYGLYGAVGSIVIMFSFINGVLSTGTSRFLTYELGKDDMDKLHKTFCASFTMHVGMALLLFLLLETIGLWFVNYKMSIPEGREFAANIVYQLSILTSMFSLTQVPYTASIIAHERMGIYAYVGLAEAIFKLILVFSLLYITFFDNLIAYAFILALWNIGLQVFYRFYCRKHFPESNLKICRDRIIYKRILSFSFWDFIGAFCSTGSNQGLNLLINVFYGVTVNAARSVAYQVENVLTQFTSNFMTAVNPQIVKSYAKGDYNRFFELIYEAGKYSYYLLFLITLPIFLEADYILSLWLVEVPEYTTVFLRCIMAITLFRVIARPLINGVHATGNIKALNLTSGIYNTVTYLPGIYIFYKLGFPVWTCFCIHGLNAIVCTYLEIRSLKLNIKFKVLDYLYNVYFKSFSVTIVASILPVFFILYLSPSIWRLFLTVSISLLSTACTVYFWGIPRNTKALIRQYIGKQIGLIN